MKYRGLKMLGVTVACALFVPLLALALARLSFVKNIRFAVAAVVFIILLAASLLYLRGKRVERREWVAAAVVCALTLFYTIPLMPIAVLAAISTAAAFLALCQMKKNGAPVRWYQKSVSANLRLFGGITLFYICIYGFQHGSRFAFFPKDALQCLAPAVSEEIIFRGVLTAALFLLFRLDDGFSANVWVFVTLTVPFAFLHVPESFLAGDAGAIFAFSCTCFFNTAVDYWLARRYGLAYAVYSHALCDYLVFMLRDLSAL